MREVATDSAVSTKDRMSHMPLSSARRSRTKTKKRSRRIVLYVPDTFDPDVHLHEELRNLADYARYLLHRINVGRVHLRKGNCLVYLKHDYLARFMPRGMLTRIRDALVEADVISVRKFCVPGELCYGYRLLRPHDQGFSHYQPTKEPLIKRIRAWRAKEFRDIRLPLHRDLRRFVKSLVIDEQAALQAVHGSPFERSAQLAMIQGIVSGDFFTVVDRFGRFHSNLTNLKATLRPFLRYRGSRLCNLDIANSQPMIFCLLLVNLLSHDDKLDNLIDHSFPETRNTHYIEIDKEYLNSIHAWNQTEEGIEEEVEGISNHNSMQGSHLRLRDNRQSRSAHLDYQEEGEGGERDTPILHANGEENNDNIMPQDNLQRANNRQGLPQDVIEFVRLCEQGVLYDELMRRLGIPARRRKGFKRLIFSQVFFGKNKQTGKVRELFARDFPTVYKAITDLKRKDYRQLAYLLQAHESKIMIEIICKKILDELPGTFIATIHDSIMTTPDKTDEVRAIMKREFQRFGLNPMIRVESY
jgi:hypothetical protein